ncbi:hypothetical protein FKM82_017586 [Ascaphus truei]
MVIGNIDTFVDFRIVCLAPTYLFLYLGRFISLHCIYGHCNCSFVDVKLLIKFNCLWPFCLLLVSILLQGWERLLWVTCIYLPSK